MYITPEKLHEFNSSIRDNRIKYDSEVGTLFHCMWECEKIQKFWKEIFQLILSRAECAVPVDANVFFFFEKWKEEKVD